MSNPVSYIIFWVFCVYFKLLFICPAKTVISNKTACNDTVKYVNKLLMERISLIGMKVTNQKQNWNQPIPCFSMELAYGPNICSITTQFWFYANNMHLTEDTPNTQLLKWNRG